ncbi:hypothetical protein PAXINDRAFT_15771 [Paxillus involutus ATCC 200175]|uniref:Uncharacterized protein n=1 Tax=Paxillus involutus ATCC 200175 TaxID=664439 RepID=A0A0C9SSJ8_PAXIN|nr:hypothetical protein PAXINDRAFT_15771 [Paxillus involutus ATCC 200175]
MANNKKVLSAHASAPSLPEQNEPRRSRQNNTSKGGVRQQLEKVADTIDQPQQVPRQRFVVPDNVPMNPMAPTPRRARKPSQKSRKAKNLTKDVMTEGSKSGPSVQPAVAAPQAGVPVFSVPEPKLHRTAAGSRFGLQILASGYQGCPRTMLDGNHSGHHQSGTHSNNAVHGTPVQLHTTDCRTYADILWLPSCPMLRASSTTVANHAQVGLQPHSTSLSTIEEHSSTLTPAPTTTHLDEDRHIAAQATTESQSNIVQQRALRPSGAHNLFGGNSNSSLTSGSETDREEPVCRQQWSQYHEMDDEPHARETSPTVESGCYEARDEDLYAGDPVRAVKLNL